MTRKPENVGAIRPLSKDCIRSAARPIVEQIEGRLLFSGGQLDVGFGSSGYATLPDVTGVFHDVAALPDGRLLAVGSAIGYDGKPALLMARFAGNGALDRSFGYKGEVIMKYGGFTAGDRIALLNNGQFYVAGSALARFNADGYLDTTFGSGGVVAFNDGSTGTRAGIAVQADGKVLVTHGADDYPYTVLRPGQYPQSQISRYLPTGKLDAPFGTNGRVTAAAVAAGSGWEDAYPADVALQGTRILVGASLATASAGGNEFGYGVVRLNADGTRDASFGAAGVAAAPYNEGTGDLAQRVRVAPDGRIFLIGTEGDNDLDLAVFTAQGANFPTPWGLRIAGNADGTDLAFQQDGKALLFGDSYDPDQGYFVIRLNTDGTFDTTYGAPQLIGRPGALGGGTFYSGGGTIDARGGAVEAGSDSSVLFRTPSGHPRLLRLADAPPAPSATLDGAGTLHVVGSAGADVLSTASTATTLSVFSGGQRIGQFALAAIKYIRADGNDGSDWINLSNDGGRPAWIDGGAGNDTLWGGSGPNTLMGGTGDDVLTPGQGPGNNVIGGGGTDAVNFSHYTRGVEVHLDGQPDSGYSGEHDTIASDITIVYGSQFNDVIFGNASGYGPIHSVLYGNGGADTLIAGTGGNSLFGGDGNDLLLSRNSVKDVLDGGNGDNTAHIDTGLDVFTRVQHFQP